ncbi:hypothetical protein LR48_Vigan10g047200 [Vigna angularis]|uniref:TIR domain-containing protein n=1 Tax=Phaseolus angularis TaxID=3914 RepID=A0A0L9VHP3_PHAAN|nr:hypothetical protein LR48_Vigan10g047200 [Vigna angularis]
MAASSTYDVFLSFRGGYTGDSFDSNLYKSLCKRGIHTFKDDEMLLKRKESIATLLNAIEESRIAIVVLSHNYASSYFCLDELARILHCQTKGLLVIPVFYKVHPSDVRHQKGSYGEALTMHQKKFEDMEKVQKWKMALHQVANLSGYHIEDGVGYEYKFIKRIVDDVYDKITRDSFTHVSDYPIGLQSQVLEKYETLTVMNFDECRILTQLPDVSDLPNLIELSFRECENLITVHDSVGFLTRLKILRVVGCSKLISFPPLNFTSLERLELCFKNFQRFTTEDWECAINENDPVGLESRSEAFCYDVFLSFRDLDTLYGFTGYLYKALHDSGIHTFIDDENLQRGEEITPTTVQLQQGRFGEALTKHEERLKNNMEKLVKWKIALYQVAKLFSFHIYHGDGYEYELIGKIVEWVSKKINRAHYPIGLESQVQEVMKLLDVGCDGGAHMIGIHGTGGIGKSTLVQDVYNNLISERTYEVKKLNNKDALVLLKWKAFKKHYFDPRYEKLLNRAVTFSAGIPLALEVIGSNLCGKSVEEWKSVIHQLEKCPNNPVEAILKSSFDSLEEKERGVFLDLACCYKGYELAEVEDILQAHYGQNMKCYIDLLVDKSLVKLSHGTKPCYDRVTLHDLIEDMGKDIVRQESLIGPGERTRLWLLEDVRQLLENNRVS